MDDSPTARALLALELVQGSPGITADRLADKLGVSERAARRYVAILREAGIPIESVRGPYGGYRLGRGLRLPPLTFSATEALGLVMAVLDGHHAASDPTDPVGSALGKIMRALPEPVAAQAEALRKHAPRPRPDRAAVRPDPGIASRWCRPARSAAGCGSGTAPRPARSGPARWTRGRSWSATAGGTSCATRTPPTPAGPTGSTGSATCRCSTAGFDRPADLDPVAELEEHLAVGWEYDVDVLVDAPARGGGAPHPPRPRPARGGRRAHAPGWSAAPATRSGTPSSSRRSRRRSGWSAARRSGSAWPPSPSAWRRPASDRAGQSWSSTQNRLPSGSRSTTKSASSG